MRIAGLRRDVARLGRLAGVLGLGAILMAACTTTNRAPIENLAGGSDVSGSSGMSAGQPSYVVRPGDTLYSIARQHQVSWEDVARWNNIQDPSQLRVGTTLRVGTGEGSAVAQASGAQVQPIASGNVESRPLDGADSSPSAPRPEPDTSSGINWAWPADGEVVGQFNESLNKGIDIQGEVGDPVRATADGVVVYAGSGLRGYGNLLIVRHNATFLSAYAHNSRLLVGEGDNVSRGQQIAELGQSDAPSPRLHFEVRRGGTPEDPMRFLPAR